MDANVIEQGFQEVWRMFKETDKKFEETARQIKETDEKFDKYFGKLQEYERNWSKLVESLVKPSVASQFQQRGIPVYHTFQRVEGTCNGDNMEIDLFLENGDTIVLVEVKTTLRVNDVNEHIERRLQRFKRFFPRYADMTVYGAVAYIHVEEDADRYAYKQGLFVLTFTSGDLVEIINDEKFVPKAWGDDGPQVPESQFP
jgi:hypothetical protein